MINLGEWENEILTINDIKIKNTKKEEGCFSTFFTKLKNISLQKIENFD